MRLHSLSIQGYRSLYDVQLSPGQLSVVTGPNNSGKTNLMEGIEFLSEVYRHGLELAIARKGGVENIAFRRMRRTKRPLEFRVRAVAYAGELESASGVITERGRLRPDWRDAHFILTHSFGIGVTSARAEADFVVTDEEVQITVEREGRERDLFRLSRDAEGIQIKVPRSVASNSELETLAYPMSDRSFAEYLRRALGPTTLAVGELFNPLLFDLTQRLSAIRLYQLVPLECRQPGVPTPNADIESHGRNLPALVRFMRDRHPAEWQRVINAMKRVIPALEDIETAFTIDRRLALQFEERGVGRPWSSEDISDGTLQALALFCALYDPRKPLLLIEEPENSVHPWILRNFVDVCREVEEKQIVITTHSPVLIDYLTPDEVFVAWRDGRGRTHLSPLSELDPDAPRLWHEGNSTLFELLDSGLVRESVPRQGDSE